MKIILAILAVLLVLPVHAQLAAPYNIQDTRTPEAKHGEFILALATVSQSDSVTLQIPTLDVGYGILNSLSIRAKTHYNLYFKGAQDAKGGGDNMVIGLKWRFLGDPKAGVSFALAPTYSFPGAMTSQDPSTALAPHDTIAQVPLVLTMRGTEGSVLFQIGIEKHTENPGYQNRILAGAFAYLISPQFEMMFEYFGRNREDNGDRESIISLGGRYEFSPQIGLVVSVGQNTAIFTGQEQKYFSYTGCRWKF